MNRLLLLVPLFFSSIVSASTYFVSPTGKDSNPGTISAPWATFQKAITVAYAGDTVYFRGGTYYPMETITIDLGNSPNIGRSGTPDNPICYFNYPGEAVIFDLINIKPAPSNWSAGISVSYADFIYMRGFEIKNLFQYHEEVMVEAVQNYMCSNIQYENFKVHHNSGVAFKYTGAAGVDGYEPPVYRYSYDTVRFINCDAYHNCDSLVIQGNMLGNRADGFKVQNQNYTYVYFEGCRAWNNSDDGFDPSGDAFRDFLNCWSFNNGYLEGDGYGWKMSGPGIDVSTMTLQLKRCIAANNSAWGFGEVDQPGYYKNVAKYYNNIAYHNEWGFGNDWRDIEPPVIDRDNIFRNNISYDNQNTGYDPDVQLYNYIHDHNSWDSDVTVSDADFLSLDVGQLERPRQSDGSLPDVDFLKLVPGSDLIDTGIAVGLPYSGTAPDLGYAEYLSGSVTVPVPLYVSSTIENTTPSRLEMTYNLTLASIVPATSAFSVTVNSSTRSVSSVSISGTKVYLTLASPVGYGDIVTVAYTKPATNPLQNAAGGQAASITARNVVNNVVAVSPVFVSAVIENATLSRLEMTYNLTLASIVPATSAFSVTVNSSTRSVSSVSISGTKVYLTLASPVGYGDIVTVAYTKPATNPLQTAAGGQAASITARNVVNNVVAVSPVFVSAVVENATPSRLEMTYNLTLASVVPATSAFSVTVNSSTRSVSSVSISGTKVYLTLNSPVVYGDIVTVAYTKPATNPLQTSAGGQAASITPRNVVNNVVAVSPVFVSAVIENATPSRLEMTYNLTLASIVPATSAFTVTVNSSTRSVSSVSISGTKVYLTLASPVVYGDIVTVAYTKPATNPLQTAAGGQAASITAQSVINNCSLTANQPPIITITSPTKSIIFVAPATITIEATASDPDGSISKVEFYNGNTKLGENSVAPFSFTWKEVPEGTFTLTAVAIDNLNSKTVSAPVEIIVEKSVNAVNQQPVISILKPNKDKKHKKNDDIVIEVAASDPDGTISKVEFKNGSTTIGEVTTAPYIYVWENVDTGTYLITAIATDNLGATTTSAEVKLSVLQFYDGNSEIISLYPNPNDGYFAIDIYSGLPEQNNRITVFSLSGKTVFSNIIIQQDSYMEFDLSNQTAGTYVLMVTSGNNIVATKKFIKK